jgi:hypothetical protein
MFCAACGSIQQQKKKTNKVFMLPLLEYFFFHFALAFMIVAFFFCQTETVRPSRTTCSSADIRTAGDTLLGKIYILHASAKSNI